MVKLKLRTWSNNQGETVDELKKHGNKIIAVSKSDSGHIITYKHKTLTRRPTMGDLVVYYPLGENKRQKGIITETDKGWSMVIDHVEIKHQIIAIGSVTKIIKKQYITKDAFQYLGYIEK